VNSFPGVNSATIINVLPMTSGYNNSFKIEGEPPLPPGIYHAAEFRVINEDYFRIMKIPLKNGRFFTEQDNGEGKRVVLVNETMVRKYFPNENPIGKRLIVRKKMLQIIGIVDDEKTGGWGKEFEPIMYQPYHQDCSLSMSLAIRTNVPPTNLALGIKKEIWTVDPDLPISKVETMKNVVYKTLSIQLFCMQLFGFFAALALLLASIGIYGVMSHSVSQRSHEIGIRMALGAQKNDVLKLILKQGLVLILSGVCIGILVAFGMSRVIAGLLYEMSAIDVTVFIFVPFFLAFVALMACYLPAHKAAKTDPMVALRHE
jgi:putative ABC transport system permease protein